MRHAAVQHPSFQYRINPVFVLPLVFALLILAGLTGMRNDAKAEENCSVFTPVGDYAGSYCEATAP